MSDEWLSEVCGLEPPVPPDPALGMARLEALAAVVAGAETNAAAVLAVAALLQDEAGMMEILVTYRLTPDAVVGVLTRLSVRRGLGSHVARILGILKKKAKKLEDQERRAPPLPPPPAQGTVVDYTFNADTIRGFFDALLAAIAPLLLFFQAVRDMVFIRRGVGPFVLNERNLPGCLSAFLEIRFSKMTDCGPQFLRFGILPQDYARAFTADPRVLNLLPRLRYFCRSPLFDEEFRFIGKPGYHAEAEIYYDGPEVAPRDGTDRLCEAIEGFHWKSEADLVNFVGGLLTAITMPNWGHGHPFLPVNGNKPGVGKSTLIAVLAVIVEGAVPSTVSYTPDETEFEKQLATRVEAGDRVIVIDNAKHRGGIDSAVLERSITDTRPNFRRLGTNTPICREQNDILFCLTMNLSSLGTDLRRRALPVNLVLETDVRTTTYAQPDVVAFALEHRNEILGELAGMVQRWLDKGRPQCESPANHSTGQRWAATIDAILRLSGFDGFLTNFEESTHAFDPKFDLMQEIAREHHGKPAATAAEWAELLAGNIMEDRFRERNGTMKSARARATAMGLLLGAYLDERFVVEGRRYRLVQKHPEGDGRKPTYRFEEVAS